MKRIYLIIKILLVFLSTLNAQDYSFLKEKVNLRESNPFNPFPSLAGSVSRDFIPPSPQSASLGIFGQIPVGNYTGTAQINIPIYEIKYKELSVPISISYHASGNKPDILPGPVGVGWALQCGGVITRIVKGNPDFGLYLTTSSPGGIYRSVIKDPRNSGTWMTTDSITKFYFRQKGIPEGTSDPDEFHFNINGKTGKFYLDHNLKANTFSVQSPNGGYFSVKMEKENYFIGTFMDLKNHQTRPEEDWVGIDFPKMQQSDTLISQIRKIIMTDEKGIKYVFGGSFESIEYSRPGFGDHSLPYTVLNKHGLAIYVQPTSWYLTSIESPNGYQIEFKYDQNIVVTKTRIHDLLGYKQDSFAEDFDHKAYGNAIKSNLINICTLKEIKSPAGKGYFGYKMDNGKNQLAYPYRAYSGKPMKYAIGVDSVEFGALHNDFKYYKDIFLADTERYYDINPKYAFTPPILEYFDYFINNSPDLAQSWVYFVYNYSNKSRLRLNGISICGDPCFNYKEYSFVYNSTNLPHYLACQTDLYGFYNGKYLFQALDNDGIAGSYEVLIGNDFSVGKTQYRNSIINQLKPDLHYAKAEILEKVIYPTGGYSSFEYELHDYSASYHTFPFEVIKNNNGNETTAGLRISSIKNYDSDDKLLTEKKYHYVKNYLKGNKESSGILAYTPQYFEDIPAGVKVNSGNPSASKQQMDYFSRFSNMPIYPMSSTRGNHITYSEVTVEETGNGYTVYKYKNYDNGYMDHEPLVYQADRYILDSGGDYNFFRDKEEGMSMALERGQILSQEIYDNNKSIVKAIRYNYNDDENRFNENVRYIRFVPTSFNAAYTGEYYQSYRFSAGYHYTYFPYLKRKKTVDYISTTDSIVTVQEYDFIPQYRLLKEARMQDSRSKWLKTVYSYPHEELNLFNHNDMVERNMLDYPYISEKKYDGTTIERNSTIYGKYIPENIILPSFFFKGYGDSRSYTTNIPERDFYGNPLQVISDSGETCILWSYKGQYPVAVIENATYDDVQDALAKDGTNSDELSKSDSPNMGIVDMLRHRLPNAHVTIYKHKPSIGMVEETDSRGVTTYYDYDELGRLLKKYFFENGDRSKEKTIESYEYHYKNK